MEAALAIGFMFLVWILVIWGAIYFNHNVQ